MADKSPQTYVNLLTKRDHLLTKKEKRQRREVAVERTCQQHKSALPRIPTVCACGRKFKARSVFQKKCPACQKRKTPLPVHYERVVNKRRKRKDL